MLVTMKFSLRLANFVLGFTAIGVVRGQYETNIVPWPQCWQQEDFYGTCTAPACPDCDVVECFPKLDPNDCPEGYIYRENVIYGGCCPACVSYITDFLDEFCRQKVQDEIDFVYTLPCTDIRVTNDEFVVVEQDNLGIASKIVPIVDIYQCLEQVECNETGNKCSLPEDLDPNAPKPYDPSLPGENPGERRVYYTSTIYNCIAQAKWYDDWTSNESSCSFQLWDVSCDGNGHYAKVQRKQNEDQALDKKDMCFSPEGKRIYGYTSKEDRSLNCECSRKFWELSQKDFQKTLKGAGGEAPVWMWGRGDVTLHCQPDGDYENLQCDDGRCWCADSATGRPTSTVVAESLFRMLPCYEDETVMGAQYLRRCESRWAARERGRRMLELHGHDWTTSQEDIVCDMDGSFGPYRCVQSQEQCFCTDRFGAQIAQYQSPINDFKGKMDCTCARDAAEELTTLTCDTNTGAYETVQTFPNLHCVDSDGFPYTGYYPVSNCHISTCDETAISEYCVNNDGKDTCLDDTKIGCRPEDATCDNQF